jgi:hypothetical protein
VLRIDEGPVEQPHAADALLRAADAGSFDGKLVSNGVRATLISRVFASHRT